MVNKTDLIKEIYSHLNLGEYAEASQLISQGAHVDQLESNSYSHRSNTLLFELVEDSFTCVYDHEIFDQLIFLLAHGADVELKNKDGESPLSLAKKYAERFNELVLLLAASRKKYE